ncbi:MAG TPA: TIGR03089 family protein [Mycobacteriales bacterium]|nr:TIGR03089 family protein [Mycobacteriales bacterium]
MTPYRILTAAVGEDPGRPLLTYYRADTGERTELSRVTTHNWVAKSANLLRDELGLDEGDRADLLLPLHWQTAVLLLGCWAVGLRTRVWAAGTTPDRRGALVIAAAERLAEARAVPGDGAVLGVSLRPFGKPLTDPPAGVTDYAAEVLGQADQFGAEAGPEAAVLDLGERLWTATDLADEASSAATELGLGPADRVLCALDYATLPGLRAGLLGPLAGRSGIVLAPGADRAWLARLVRPERITAAAGVDIDGLRRLG